MHKTEAQFLNRDALVFLAGDPAAAGRIKILFWFQHCLFLIASAGVTSSSWKESTQKGTSQWHTDKALVPCSSCSGRDVYLGSGEQLSTRAARVTGLGLMYHGTGLLSLSCIVSATGFFVNRLDDRNCQSVARKSCRSGAIFLCWAPVPWCHRSSSVTEKEPGWRHMHLKSFDGWISLSCIVPDKQQPFCNTCCNACKNFHSMHLKSAQYYSVDIFLLRFTGGRKKESWNSESGKKPNRLISWRQITPQTWDFVEWLWNLVKASGARHHRQELTRKLTKQQPMNLSGSYALTFAWAQWQVGEDSCTALHCTNPSGTESAAHREGLLG